MSHYPLLREASSRSLGLGSSEHPSDLSYNGPRPLLQWTPSTTPQGNPAYRPTACPGPHCLTIHTGWLGDQSLGCPEYVTTLPPNVTCRRVTHPRADRARRCLTSNEVGRVNHIARKASSLARVLISLICHISFSHFASWSVQVKVWMCQYRLKMLILTPVRGY